MLNTADRIRGALSTFQPLSVEVLAATLRMSRNTVASTIYRMQDKGKVRAEVYVYGRGRPKHRYWLVT